MTTTQHRQELIRQIQQKHPNAKRGVEPQGVNLSRRQGRKFDNYRKDCFVVTDKNNRVQVINVGG